MTKEQAALLQKAKQSLKAAQLLSDQGYFEFAVSRAYYTMFYLAEAMLLEESLSYSKHSSVIAAFGNKFTRTGFVPPEFHRYLIEGQNSRNICDYDIKPGISQAEAHEQINRAKKFLELAENLIGQ